MICNMQNPEYQRAEIEVKTLRKRVKEEEKRLKEFDAKEDQRLKDVADLQQQLADVIAGHPTDCFLYVSTPSMYILAFMVVSAIVEFKTSDLYL